MGTWKNLQKGFTAYECLSGTVADDCVRLISRNHSQRQKEVTKKAALCNFGRLQGKNVNGPDKNCPVLPNAYGCHLNSRIIRSFISV